MTLSRIDRGENAGATPITQGRYPDYAGALSGSGPYNHSWAAYILPRSGDTVTRAELDWAWSHHEPIEGAAFGLHDAVRILAGPHAGRVGSARSLLALEPEPRYLVELVTGEGVEAAEVHLSSAHLTDTELAECPFAEVADLESEREWLVCRVRDGQFEASGGPFMLERMLDIFTSWAAAAPAAAQPVASVDEGRGILSE